MIFNLKRLKRRFYYAFFADQKSLHYPVSKPCRVMVWQAKTNLYCGTIAVYQLYFIN
ncbi:hypothetical protein CHK_3046 [Christensenella hongkongensis]|uniref:Uncharacterized protein n=1 Tax=Christensenella hongkongensis TaxID=270498 RepID=A0A0M2NB42_9FIRM|nr:hypothetical protein CHK_3046 [Christensenella hongkongensis]